MRKDIKIRLSRTQRFFLILLFIICVFIRTVVVGIYRNIQTKKLETTAKTYAESVATSINLSLNHHINTSVVLKELYLEYHDNFLKDFGIISKRLVAQNPEICSLYMAPDGIISAAYHDNCENEENSVINEMINRPVQGERAQLAVDTRKITVAGPHVLVEGGTGFIIRNPIFEDDEFSAFSIVVLNWDKFVTQILNNVARENSGYHFAVWKENDTKAVTDENGYILKSGVVNNPSVIDIPISIPNDVWHLTVEPVGGWQIASSYHFELFMTFFIVIVPLIAVYLRQKRNALNIYIAQHDDLTQLLSRSAFLRLTEKIFRIMSDTHFNIIATDIENFKVTNSMYGTERCDEVLKYLAKKIQEKCFWGLCTRFGSDHFVFVMQHKDTEKDIAELESFAAEVLNDSPIDTLSVKFGFYGDIDKKVPINLSCDKALLAAKSILHHYDKFVANYDGPLSTQNIKYQVLESSFLDAIKNNDFKIWFQPKYDAYTEELVGAEALVRWIKADGTIISPADFIHVFEEDGLIYKLDLYVFEKVCRAIKGWQDKGYKNIPVSINISRNSLQHKNIIKEYEKILTEVGLSAEYVPLEITESSTSANKQIKELTEDLKTSGFKIHMDDFGTGLSSLESINLLPFDVIKLDKSLIDFIGTPVGEELLRHTIELFQFMKLKTIAEGVETKEQLEFLKKLHCDYIQGYYFSAPVPYEKYEKFLEEIEK